VEFCIRLILQIAICTMVIAFFIVSSRSHDAALILYLPFFLGIPALLCTGLVLAPMEALLGRRGAGGWIYILVPLLAALVPWLLFPLARNLGTFINGSMHLSVYAFLWGMLWMATRLLYRGVAALFRRKPV